MACSIGGRINATKHASGEMLVPYSFTFSLLLMILHHQPIVFGILKSISHAPSKLMTIVYSRLLTFKKEKLIFCSSPRLNIHQLNIFCHLYERFDFICFIYTNQNWYLDKMVCTVMPPVISMAKVELLKTSFENFSPPIFFLFFNWACHWM